MAGENSSQDETDGNSDVGGSEITNETEANRCTCVEGQVRKCLYCRRQQQRFNSETYRNKLITERAQLQHERDNEHAERKKLDGQLSVYANRFAMAVEYASQRCQNCGAPVDHLLPLVAEDEPNEETHEDDVSSVQLADCEKFLHSLKQQGPNPMKARRREQCEVCTDDSCAVCVRKKNSRETAARSRERKRNDFEQCQFLLQWAIDEIRKREGMKAELCRQNAKLKEAVCRRHPASGGIYAEAALDSKPETDTPPHKRAALDYFSSVYGRSPPPGPSGLQRGGQEAVNAATVLRGAGKKDDEDDNASMDGHHELLRGMPREDVWREVAGTPIQLTVLGRNPPPEVAQGGSTDWESVEVSSVGTNNEPVRHVRSLGTPPSVGITYAAPPSPPHGSYPEAFALRPADAANVMLTDAQGPEMTQYEEDLKLALEIVKEETERENAVTVSGPSPPAVIVGDPDQHSTSSIAQSRSTEYAGGGASPSSGPSQSAAPVLPHGGVRPSGPSDDASNTGDSQPDGSTTKRPGFVHSAYEAVRNIGMKVRSNPKEKNVFARTQIAAPAIPPTSNDVQFKAPSLASKHSQPLSSPLSVDDEAVGLQSINIYHFMPPDAPTVESDGEGDLLADYELVDELSVLTLTEDDYGQHGTVEQQENFTTAVNEVDQMPEAAVDASGFSNAGAVLETPEETEQSTSSGDESSDDDTEDEENP